MDGRLLGGGGGNVAAATAGLVADGGCVADDAAFSGVAFKAVLSNFLMSPNRNAAGRGAPATDAGTGAGDGLLSTAGAGFDGVDVDCGAVVVVVAGVCVGVALDDGTTGTWPVAGVDVVACVLGPCRDCVVAGKSASRVAAMSPLPLRREVPTAIALCDFFSDWRLWRTATGVTISSHSSSDESLGLVLRCHGAASHADWHSGAWRGDSSHGGAVRAVGDTVAVE